MKLPDFAVAAKIGVNLFERAKIAVNSRWDTAKPLFRKYGDKLLFALALAVIAGFFYRSEKKSILPAKENPGIVFTQWHQDDFGDEIIRSIIAEFEDIHEGIKIAINYKPYPDIMNELYNPDALTEDESGENRKPFDIIALDPLWVPDLLTAGTIETSVPADNNTMPENANAQILSYINVLFYNINMLKDAGFSRPPKTRSEFLTQARAVISNDESRCGLAMGLASSRGIYDDVYPWVWSAGAQMIKNGDPAVDSRQVIEALGFLAALVDDGLVNANAFNADSEKKLEDFISGKAAFMIAPACAIELVRKQMGEDAFGISSVPSSDNTAGVYYYASAGLTLGINPASSNKEEARQFADFLAEKTSIFQAMDDPFYSKAWDISISGEQAQDFSGLPWKALDAISRHELQSLFSKDCTPIEAASAIQKGWEEVLRQPQ